MQHSNLISLENIRFSYDAFPFISNISFNVVPGEHIALVGPNGCGKTTLFNLLCGFLKPSGGQILFEGKKIHTMHSSYLAKRIAIVPQGNNFNFPYSALETVLMGLFPHRNRFDDTSSADMERVRLIMHETCIWEFASKPVTELSGGQLQRVILARALLQAIPNNHTPHHPPLLLLDEAFSELDIAARLEMMQIVDAAVKKHSLTVISIHHDLHLAYKFADRIIAMQNGSVVADGIPTDVFTGDFFKNVFGVKAEIIAGRGFLFG
ncbi:iron ABC transporter [Spirochaetia bacterium]|nr:iron ABC transporter [Spirochaetia bacterium]